MTPSISRTFRLGQSAPRHQSAVSLPMWLLTVAISAALTILSGYAFAISWQDVGAITGAGAALLSIGAAIANGLKRHRVNRQRRSDDDKRRDEILESVSGLPAQVAAMASSFETRMTHQDRALKTLADGQEALRSGLASAAAVSKAAVIGSATPTFMADGNGNCTFANPAYEELVGRPYTQLLGAGWEDVLHQEDRELLLERWQRCTRERQPFAAECRYVLPSGVVVRVRIEARAVDSGAEVTYIGTSRRL